MFMSDISLIVRKMRTCADRNAATIGVGFPEQLVLMHLKAHGASNQETIALAHGIDKGAIAKTIAKLEEKGLVEREVNPANKREKLVTLLPVANDVIAQMGESYSQLQELMFQGMDAREQEVLLVSLSKVAENLNAL